MDKQLFEIEMDIARDIISECFAITAKELAKEKEAIIPNDDKIAALKFLLHDLHYQRLDTSYPNIVRALYIYPVILKGLKNEKT